jgi:hypothetical protein
MLSHRPPKLQRDSASLARTANATGLAPSPVAGPSAAAPDPAASSALTAQAAQLRSAYEARQRLRTSNPDFQQLAVRAARIGARVDYASLLRRLDLTSEQLARFEALVANHAGTTMDLAGARAGLGLRADDPALSAEKKLQEQHFQSQLADIIGPQGVADFLRFEADLGMREFLRTLAENVYYTDTPLSAVQSCELSDILARHFPALENLDPRWRSDPAAWDSVLREARQVLSPAQVAALASIGDEMAWTVESVSELNRSLPEASR